MREYFHPVPFLPHPTQIWDKDEKTWKEIINFRASQLAGSCYYSYYSDLKDELEGKPKIRITEELSNIFDMGSEIHEEDEDFSDGARGLIAKETDLKIMHDSKKFTISGHYDKKKVDLYGRYYEDLKSCKLNGLVYFLMDYLKTGHLSKEYRYQIGIYSYMDYITLGYHTSRGVITKIVKIDEDYNKEIEAGTHFYSCPKCYNKYQFSKDIHIDTHRCKLSLEDTLPSIKEIRNFIYKHPVIRAIIKPKEYNEEWLMEQAIAQMKEYVNAYNEKCWRCTNCQRAKNCEVKQTIEG